MSFAENQGKASSGALRDDERKRLRSDWIVRERFFTLYDQMLGEVSLPEVLKRVGPVVSFAMNAESTTVYLIREATQELEANVLIHNVSRTIRIPICEKSLAGFCALTSRSFIVLDAHGDLSGIDPRLHFDRSWDEAHGFRTRDVICAPAVFKGKTVGVVQVLNSRDEAFCEEDLSALASVSRLVGYALYHAKLYDDLATMKQLDKEKAKFVDVMTHELKAPLGAAGMMLGLLDREGTSEEQRKNLVERIKVRLGGLQELIKEMLELSRLQAGKPLGEVKVVDLSKELGRLCEPYRESAEAKGLRFEVQTCDVPLNVRIDTRGLELIVSNLLSNAVKYSTTGEVRANVELRDGRAELSVRDQGIGIPENDIPKLFTEFFRASNAKRQGIDGSGVGLAGIKQIVEGFGGELSLSTKEDKGSEFVVSLPVC